MKCKYISMKSAPNIDTITESEVFVVPMTCFPQTTLAAKKMKDQLGYEVST